MGQHVVRLLLSLAGVILITWTGYSLLPVNATTNGFAYLLLVLIIASFWGFFEAAVTSFAATLAFNFFFFPPVGRFTIADPQNWVALFSFLTTALIASRLSAEAKRRALDAVARQQDLERLYTFSRAILLIDDTEPFPKQLVRKLAEIFELSAAVLYERRTEEFYRAGPSDFEGLDDQLRDAALQGTSFTDAAAQSHDYGGSAGLGADCGPRAAGRSDAGCCPARHRQPGRHRTGAGAGAGSRLADRGRAAK